MQPVAFPCGGPEPCFCTILLAVIQVRCPPGAHVEPDDFKDYRLDYLPPDLTEGTMAPPSGLHPDLIPALASHSDTLLAHKAIDVPPVDEITGWTEGDKATFSLLGMMITFAGAAFGVYFQKVVILCLV